MIPALLSSSSLHMSRYHAHFFFLFILSHTFSILSPPVNHNTIHYSDPRVPAKFYHSLVPIFHNTFPPPWYLQYLSFLHPHDTCNQETRNPNVVAKIDFGRIILFYSQIQHSDWHVAQIFFSCNALCTNDGGHQFFSSEKVKTVVYCWNFNISDLKTSLQGFFFS